MALERVAAVRALDMDVALDFHGRVHKPMAKQLAAALEPHRPLFIEEPLLSENIEGLIQLSRLTTLPIALGLERSARHNAMPSISGISQSVIINGKSPCSSFASASLPLDAISTS